MKTTKKIAAHSLAWFMSVLAAAAVLTIFDDPARRSYWSSLAMISALMLTMVVASWVRNEKPTKKLGLVAITLVLVIPSLVLLFAFGPGPAVGALAGGLTGALIYTWSYFAGKDEHHQLAGPAK